MSLIQAVSNYLAMCSLLSWQYITVYSVTQQYAYYYILLKVNMHRDFLTEVFMVFIHIFRFFSY